MIERAERGRVSVYEKKVALLAKDGFKVDAEDEDSRTGQRPRLVRIRFPWRGLRESKIGQ